MWPIMFFPCGCAVDVDALCPYIGEDIGPLIECMWCQASFVMKEVSDWDSPDIWFENGARALFRLDGLLFEALRRCSTCEFFIVREYGRAKAEELHLSVPSEMVELLSN